MSYHVLKLKCPDSTEFPYLFVNLIKALKNLDLPFSPRLMERLTDR